MGIRHFDDIRSLIHFRLTAWCLVIEKVVKRHDLHNLPNLDLTMVIGGTIENALTDDLPLDD